MSQWKNVPGAICLWCGILIGMWCFSVWLEVGAGFYIGSCLNAKMWGTSPPLGPFTLFLFTWMTKFSFLRARLCISIGEEGSSVPNTVSFIFRFFPLSHIHSNLFFAFLDTDLLQDYLLETVLLLSPSLSSVLSLWVTLIGSLSET